jgi:hypothetical protein
MSNVPSFPTIDSVFADWNRSHLDKYGTYVDLRITEPNDFKAQVERLRPELEAQQQEWLTQYGDTPEGQAILREPPPTWESVYNKWLPGYQQQFGSGALNRPWGADEDAANQKKALDQAYIDELNAYNERNGTNLQPRKEVLGEDAQPNIFVTPSPKKKWYEDPMNLVALGLGGYGLYSLATAGAAGAAGTAAGAGTAGTAASLVPGSLSAELAALGVNYGAPATIIPGTTAAALNAGVTAGSLGSLAPSLLAEDIAFAAQDAAQLFETTKSIPAVQQNLIAAGVDPVVAAEAANLASMGSGVAGIETGLLDAFAGEPIFTNEGLLSSGSTLDPTGRAVSTISDSGSVIDPTDVLKQASKLVGGESETQPMQQQMSGGMQRQGVDYSGLLNLLALQAGRPQIANLLAPAQLSPQYNPYSLLG